MYTDRLFFPMTVYDRTPSADVRLDRLPEWRHEGMPSMPQAAPEAPDNVAPQHTSGMAEEAVGRALVGVSFRCPFKMAGYHHMSASGVGVIVAPGVVVTDRASVPLEIGDVELVVAGMHTVPARIAFLHPYANVAVLVYTPTAELEPLVAVAQLSPMDVKEGMALTQVGLTNSHQLVSAQSKVKFLDYYVLQGAESGRVPVARPFNLERAEMDGVTACRGGVFVDRNCRVRALWSLTEDGKSLVHCGQPTAPLYRCLSQIVSRLRHPDTDVSARWLPAELLLRNLNDACTAFGLPAAWASRIAAIDRKKKDVVYVHRVAARSAAMEVLHSGDLVLAVAGRPVNTLAAVAEATGDQLEAELTVLRAGAVLDVRVPTDPVAGGGIVDVVVWNGLVLHRTHPAVMQLGFTPDDDSDVFCSRTLKGAPGSSVQITGKWLLKVNDKPVPTLDALVSVVADIPDREYVRLTCLEMLSGRERVYTMKNDAVFSPMQRFTHTDEFEWQRRGLPEARRPAPATSSVTRFLPGGAAPAARLSSAWLPPVLKTPTLRKWLLGVVVVAAVAVPVVKRKWWRR